MKIIMLTVLNSLLMVAGQTFWKAGMIGKNINSFFDIILVMFSPLIVCGLMVYIIATFLWLYILSKAELSYVYPIQSLAFPIALFVAAFLFKETITLNRLIGAAMICIGVLLTSLR